MVRNLSIYMLISFISTPEYGYANPTIIKNFQALPFAQTTIPKKSPQKPIQQTQGPIEHLARQLAKYTIKIEDYAWTATQDHQYTPPTKDIRLAKIFTHLMHHEQVHQPLSSIASPEGALRIKEGILNILLNSRCSADEQIKQGYDTVYGYGKFYEEYKNYKKSEQLNPAHKFAVAVFKNNEHNNASLQDLITFSQDCVETTGEQWLAIKQKIETKNQRNTATILPR